MQIEARDHFISRKRLLLAGIGALAAACGETPPIPPLKAASKATAVPKPTPDYPAATPTVSIATKIAQQRKLEPVRTATLVDIKTKINPEAVRHLETSEESPVPIVDVASASDRLYALADDGRLFSASARGNGDRHPFEPVANLNPHSNRIDFKFEQLKYPKAIEASADGETVVVGGHRNGISKTPSREFTTFPQLYLVDKKGVEEIKGIIPEGQLVTHIMRIPGEVNKFLVRVKQTSIHLNVRNPVETIIIDLAESGERRFRVLNTRTQFETSGQLIKEPGKGVFAEYGGSFQPIQDEGGYARHAYNLATLSSGKGTQWYHTKEKKDPKYKEWTDLISVHVQTDQDGYESMVYALNREGTLRREEATNAPQDSESLPLKPHILSFARKQLGNKGVMDVLLYRMNSTGKFIFVGGNIICEDRSVYPVAMSLPTDRPFESSTPEQMKFALLSRNGIKGVKPPDERIALMSQKLVEIGGQEGLLSVVRDTGVVFAPLAESGHLSGKVSNLNKGIDYSSFQGVEYQTGSSQRRPGQRVK